MSAWYRNSEWSAETAAVFEQRLARARGQKAQYLSLQGYHLLAKRPEVARDLLRRAVALDDVHQAARALAFLAQAHLALGEVDAALGSYEDALERQIAQPNTIAVQPADYLLAVGYFARTDRLPMALPIARALPDDGVFGPDAQALAAKALVLDLAGHTEDAAPFAARALDNMEEMPDAAALGIDIGHLRRRLAGIAR